MTASAFHVHHTIILGRLAAAHRRRVWAWLQRERPQEARNMQRLQNDPVVQQIQAEFDASFAVEIEGDLPEQLRRLNPEAVITRRRTWVIQ